MSVICKFRVSSVELSPYGGWGDTPKSVGRRVKFSGVQGEPFGKATPSASLDMLILNPEASNQFELEGEYEVVFTKVKDGLPVHVE